MDILQEAIRKKREEARKATSSSSESKMPSALDLAIKAKKETGKVPKVTMPSKAKTRTGTKAEEKTVNSPAQRSGKSRDEFDSSVRSAYARRLEEEEKKAAEKKVSAKDGYVGEVHSIDWTKQPNRVGNVIVGAGTDYAGSMLSAAGGLLKAATTIQPGGGAVQMPEGIYIPGEDQMQVQQAAQKAIDDAGKENQYSKLLQEKGAALSKKGQEQIQSQKEGLGTVGQFAVDAGAAGTQMLMDIGIGWLTGLGMTIPMTIRTFGSGMEKAKEDGADMAGQMKYAMGTAAAAYGMERLFGIAFAGLKIAKPGLTDDFVNAAINNMAKKLATTPKGAAAIKAIGSLAASFGGEFTEEFLEAFVEPEIRKWSYDKEAKNVFQDPSQLGDMLYEGLIGGILGMGGSGVNVAVNTAVESGTEEDLKTAYKNFQSYFTDEVVKDAYESLKANGMFSTKAAQDVQKANERLQKIMPEQSKPLTAQQRADQAAYIEAAGLVGRAEDEIEAAGAIFPTGNEMTRQENERPEAQREAGSEAAGENTAGQQKENAVDLSQYPALQKFVETGEMESPAAVLTEAVNAANDGVLRYEDSEAIAQQTMAEEARINSAAQAQPAAAVMEGANENGTELRVSGERGRGTGESAGRQSGTVPESAGGRQNRSVQNIRGRDRADAVAWEYEKAHADPISTRDLFGTEKGSEDAVLRVASSRVVQSDEELRSIDREIREAGYTPYFFTGMASITSGQQAPAYVRGKNVYIRIDHPKWTAAELWAHEKYHIMADRNPGMVQQQWNELCRTMDGAALREMLKTYRDRYHGAYDIDENGNAVWNEQVMWKIVEEILADSYAGRDTYGTGVNAMTGDVRQMSQQRAGGERQTRGPPEGVFAFAGEKSATADLDALARAKEMDGQDVSAETIRQETGWFKGMDNKWRYEIDDSKMRYERRGDLGFRQRHEGYNRYRELTRKAENFMLGQSDEWLTMEEQRELTELQSTWGNTFRTDGRVAPDALPTTKLTDYIDHPELFEAYPELRDASLVFAEMPEGTRGQYDRERNIIRVSQDLRHAPQETLLHEIQHAVQQIEGFTGGASVEYWENQQQAGRNKTKNEDAIRAANQKYRDLFDAAPEEMRQMVRKINQAKMAEDWDAVLELENEIYDGPYADIYSELGDADFDRRTLIEQNEPISAKELYRNTAGEIEARDTGKRRDLTADKRKKTAPDLGGEDTVFADESARFALDDERKENNYAGHEVREETREEFLRRTSKGNGRIIEEGGISYGYVPVRDSSARPAAKETQRELNKLGIDCFVHNGVLEGNVDGKTYRAGDEATTVGKTRVGISNNIDLDPANTAGHEAFHMWVKSPDGADYVETLADNIDFASDAFRNLCTKIENGYYKNGVTLKNKTDAKRLLEEVFAYVTGDIHAGTTDTNPEKLLRDPGAVKSAWKWLVSKKAPESGGSFALDGETDERPWWEGEDEEIRSAAEMMAERNKRDPAFDIDEYLSRKMQEAEAERADRLRNIPKSEFKGTQAMEKLGIKVEGSVTRYDNADQMRKRHAAAQSVKRELRKAEKRLGATAQEKMFAGAIASGTITEDMIPQGVNRSTVMELADYYMAERAQGVDMIRQRRVDINRTLDERMGNLLKGLDKFKVNPILILNNRTPQRNMLKIFGGELGKRINEEIFDPVATNEAERIRFVNREYDKVRTFMDSKGKESKLTKEERALVQMVIEGRAVEEIVAGMEISNAIKYAAENIVNGKDPADAARQYSLDGKEQDLAVKYARWLQAQEALRSGKVDNVKVENAANTYSKLFDQYYDAINDFLVVHGYEPIGFIKGYAPHLQPEANSKLLDKALEAMGLNRNVTNLPAEIAGKTADFRPNKRWNPYFLQRTGDKTDYDIATAFESYVDHLSDVLYHTDDIMRVRRMERFFRKAYSKEDLRSEIEWAEGLRDLKPEERLDALKDAGKVSKTASLSPEDTGAKIDEIIEDSYNNMDDLTKYGEFVMWLENYANILAGKQSMVDRGGEAGAGRRILNFGNYLTALFGKAQVAGNLSSVLNQTSQLPMILSEIGSINTLRAAADMMNGKLRRDFALESDVLTGKAGVNFLVHTPGEMVINTMFTPAQWMDSMISTLAVRGAYYKAIKNGMSHEEAVKAADRYGRNVMGSREKGVKPLGFHAKNPLSQMLHVFQLEALNNWEHISQDLPQDFRKIEAEKGKAAAVAALAGVIVKSLLSAFLLNRITEETYGGTPAPFDILGMTANFIASGEGLSTNEWLMTMLDNVSEELTGERFFDTEELERDGEFDASAAFEDLGYNVSNEIPFFSNVSSLMGWGDQTLPWPDVVDTGSELLESIKEDGLLSGRTAQAALGVAGEFLPGGRQAVKTASGVQSVLQGGKMTGYGENKTLQFPTEQTLGSIARQILFGVNATPEARSYWASGDSKLSAKQTQLWQRLVDGGADSQDVYDVIQSWRNVDGDKELDSQTCGKLQRNMIRNMDMTDEQKFDMYKTLTGADSRADNFKAMMRAGMSWDEVMDAYEKHQELENNSLMKSSEQAAAFVKWAYSNLSQKEANAAVEQLAFWTTMKAKPSQATLEEQLNKTKLTNKQKTAIWNSYGWKAESPWK